jgi:triosephosphate isomerase
MSEANRTPLIAGNWKMNGSLDGSQPLVRDIVAGLDGLSGVRVLLCPPFVYLRSVAEWLGNVDVALGAQDVSERSGSGAFTGEISGAMLADLGASYVIVGHSERRALFGDTDERVAAKFLAAQDAGLVPILCVGETLEQREQGRTQAVVGGQVQAVLDAAGVAAFANAVVAYEPVWAIGTGRTASPEQAQEVHAAIRGMIAALDDTIAARLALLYGGSVKGANAAELLAMDDIDGGLIGGASLQAEEFLAICRAASQ